MVILVLLLVVAICEGIAIDKPKELHLQAPKLKWFDIKDDTNNITSHMIMRWTGVKSNDLNDPVIGYKLKVWEIEKINETVLKTQDGEVVSVVKQVYPKINANIIPDGLPKEFIIPANETSTTFYDMHLDVAYQFAILAFTAKGEGPLSSPTRVRLHK